MTRSFALFFLSVLALGLVACSGGNSTDGPSNTTGITSVRLVIDTANGTDARVSAQLDGVVFEQLDGSLRAARIERPTRILLADPDGEFSGIALREVDEGVCSAVHLIFAPGSVRASMPDGSEEPVIMEAVNHRIAFASPQRIQADGTTYRVHVKAPRLERRGGGYLQWEAEMGVEEEESSPVRLVRAGVTGVDLEGQSFTAELAIDGKPAVTAVFGENPLLLRSSSADCSCGDDGDDDYDIYEASQGKGNAYGHDKSKPNSNSKSNSNSDDSGSDSGANGGDCGSCSGPDYGDEPLSIDDFLAGLEVGSVVMVIDGELSADEEGGQVLTLYAAIDGGMQSSIGNGRKSEVTGRIASIDYAADTFTLDLYQVTKGAHNLPDPLPAMLSVDGSDAKIKWVPRMGRHTGHLDFDSLEAGMRVEVEWLGAAEDMIPAMKIDIRCMSQAPLQDFKGTVVEIDTENSILGIDTGGDDGGVADVYVTVDGETVILPMSDEEGEPIDRFQLGDEVFVLASEMEDGSLLAEFVRIARSGIFDIEGMVVSIDDKNSMLGIDTGGENGEKPDVMLYIGDETVILPLSDEEGAPIERFALGDMIRSLATERDDGGFDAGLVVIQQEPPVGGKIKGTVVAIDDENSVLGLISGVSAGGEPDLMLTITDDTVILPLVEDEVAPIDRFELGDVITAVALQEGDTYTALLVVIAQEPEEGVKIEGMVVAIDDKLNTLGIDTGGDNGAKPDLVLAITDDTLILPLIEEEIAPVERFELGDQIAAVAIEEADGSFTALLVVIAPDVPEGETVKGVVVGIDAKNSLLAIDAGGDNGIKPDAFVRITDDTVILPLEDGVTDPISRFEVGDQVLLVVVEEADLSLTASLAVIAPRPANRIAGTVAAIDTELSTLGIDTDGDTKPDLTLAITAETTILPKEVGIGEPIDRFQVGNQILAGVDPEDDGSFTAILVLIVK